MNLQFDFGIARASDPVLGRDRVPQLFRDALADIDMIVDCVVRVARETIYMDLGKKVGLLGFLGGVCSEQRFMARVDAREGFKEIDGCGGQVHDIVIENRGPGV